MAEKKTKPARSDETAKLLKNLLIVELGLAGVSQRKIRTIVGGDISYVNKIMKLLPKKPEKNEK